VKYSSNHRLNDRQIRLILSTPGPSQGVADLAGVTSPAVCYIRRLATKAARRVYDEMVAEGLHPHVVTTPKAARNRFTPADIESIRASSVPSTHLAASLGCSASLIRMIRTGKSYR